MNHDSIEQGITSALLKAGYKRLHDHMTAHSEWVDEIVVDSTVVHLSAVVFQQLKDKDGTFLDIQVEAFQGNGSVIERDQCSYYEDDRIVCEILPIEK